jgi:hypothetical protein
MELRTGFYEKPENRNLILFYEYFHGDNGRGLGASHQSGWTALVAELLNELAVKVKPNLHKCNRHMTRCRLTISG